MHYRNGREAKPGDKVLQLNGAYPIAGYLVNLTASSSCNGTLLPINGGSYSCVTVSDCLHIDDIEAAFPAAAPQ